MIPFLTLQFTRLPQNDTLYANPDSHRNGLLSWLQFKASCWWAA